MNRCNDKCRNEKSRGTRNLYANGYKRCTVCDKAVKTRDIFCFCCGAKYRTGSQAGIHRQIRVELTARRI